MPAVNGSRARRLSALEKTLSVRDSRLVEFGARDEAHRQAMDAAWSNMQATMSEEHARLFLEKFQVALRDGWDALRNDPAEHFTRVCSGVLYQSLHEDRGPYSEIRPAVRFAMPPEVAQVYLDHWRFPLTALPLHDCQDCGFRVPIIYGNQRDLQRSFFDRCPLCGGEVGWYAYRQKHLPA